ncbi:MAG: serpin family protein [Clostridiales bacterium]|nr:serpin family protein [Clostridiales bacterium]
MKHILRIFPFFLVLIFAASCTSAPSASGAVLLAEPVKTQARGMKKNGAPVGERKQYREGYTDTLAAFSAKAVRAALLEKDDENALFSPAGLYFSLAALAGSAGGETKAEILAALGMAESEIASETGKLRFNLNVEDQMGEIRSAGSFWLDRGFGETMDAGAVKALAETYGMEFYESDLASAAAGEQIGAWVQEKTGGRLGGDGSAFAVDPETALMLLSTVYYKDEWIDRFDKEKTAADIFTNADGSEAECDFLNATYGVHIFSRYEGEGASCTVSSLSLKHGSMIFILPDEGLTPYDVLRDENAIAAILSGSTESYAGEVVWQIPKFSYAAETELSEALGAMGVKEAFNMETADFSGLLKEENTMPLWVGGVKQCSRIGIDENGVEAAGYTRIDYAGSPMPTDRAEMILTRPFLYAIRSEGSVLFFGILNTME